MIDILELYDIIDAQGIRLRDFSLVETGSISIRTDELYAIGLDYQAFESAVELRERLAHEVGHCVTDSFYNCHAAIDLHEKHERTAEKWTIKKLIPKDELEALCNEIDASIEYIAEYFGVSIELIRKAGELYFT